MLLRKFIQRHADYSQRQQRLRPHGIDIRQRIGCCNTTEIKRIIDNRSKKISGRHQRLRGIDLIHRCIIRRLGAHQQLRWQHTSGHGRHDALQHGW